VRCFLAIELPSSAVASLSEAARTVRELDSAWAGEKWVRPDAMHVTLKFLGDLEKSTVDRLESEFSEAFSCQRAFSLSVSDLRAMPRASRASMIWAVAEDLDGQCAMLADAADRVASVHGIEPERRPFTPHITLARARRPHAISQDVLAQAGMLSRLADLDSVSVLSATLFSSTLTPSGPIHERLAGFELLTD
jgi:2'-5' RNA ligase